MTSVRVDCAPPNWKRAQAQRLNKARMTMEGDEDQDPASKEVWIRLVIIILVFPAVFLIRVQRFRKKVCTRLWNRQTQSEWVYWCLTSHTTIFQLYTWRHRCAGGLKKKLYIRSGSQRHRHLAGFFYVPVLHRHRAPPYYMVEGSYEIRFAAPLILLSL